MNVPESEIRASRRLLQEALRLVDSAIRRKRQGGALQIVIYTHLLALYEMGQGILKLKDGHAFQTFPIMRSMLEVTTNLRWILLADMNEHAPEAEDPKTLAERYMSWETLDAIELYRKWQAPDPKVLAKLEADRDRNAKEFAYRSSGGKTLWSHWAVNKKRTQRKSLQNRMDDVRAADARREDDENLANPAGLYTVYGSLSSVAHLSPTGVHHLFEVIGGPEGRRRRRSGPSMPGMSYAHSHACLMTAIACARPHFPLSKSDEEEFHALWERCLDLTAPAPE